MLCVNFPSFGYKNLQMVLLHDQNQYVPSSITIYYILIKIKGNIKY